MKQQVSPAIIAVCLVVIIGLAVFAGSHFINRSGATASTPEAPQTTRTVDGQKVPPGAPVDMYDRYKNAPQGQGQPTHP